MAQVAQRISSADGKMRSVLAVGCSALLGRNLLQDPFEGPRFGNDFVLRFSVESCHADHSIPIVLDYEDVCTYVKTQTLLVFKNQRCLVPLDGSGVGEFPI